MSEIIKNEVTDAILKRRSIRGYHSTQLKETELSTIIEAGIWAPTAGNQQELDFFVIRDREKIEMINRRFLAFTDREGLKDFSYGAPALILIYARPGSRYAECDAGIAVENMALAAQSLGLGSVIIGIIRELMDSEDGKSLAKSFGAAEGWSFCIAIAIGHTAKPTEAKPRREGRVHFA